MRTWDFGTYRIVQQRRLKRDGADAQNRKSLYCSHTQSMDEDEERLIHGHVGYVNIGI